MSCFGEMRYALIAVRCTRALMLMSIQVEYLVVTYSKDDPKVLLSLRQAEILTALAADQELAAKGGCVPALQDVIGNGNGNGKA